jgi:putative flippase GtrA
MKKFSISNLLNRIKEKEKYVETFKSFIKFSLVGVLNVIVNLIVYYILVYFGMKYVYANMIGYFCGVLNSFFWNKKFVFKKSDNRAWKILVKTGIVYTFTFILGTIIMVVFVEYLGITELIAPILLAIIITPINYVLNKIWAYK